jgi:hypothetical protein
MPMKYSNMINLLMLAIAVGACTEKPWQPDTKWHNEGNEGESVSFLGSYQNAIDTLKIDSHAWKLIGLRSEEKCEWGFKVTISFPDHPDYAPTDWGDLPYMPISKIQYNLFDIDGFLLTSLTLDHDRLGVAEGQTETFQTAGFLNVIDAKRVHSGQLNVKAGYIIQKPSSVPELPQPSDEFNR